MCHPYSYKGQNLPEYHNVQMIVVSLFHKSVIGYGCNLWSSHILFAKVSKQIYTIHSQLIKLPLLVHLSSTPFILAINSIYLFSIIGSWSWVLQISLLIRLTHIMTTFCSWFEIIKATPSHSFNYMCMWRISLLFLLIDNFMLSLFFKHLWN
mgnify:CR=1 FL=1